MASAVIATSTPPTLGLFSLRSLVLLSGAWVAMFGINYSWVADDLPFPSQVAALLGSLNIIWLKPCDADPNFLEAFSDIDVAFIIGFGTSISRT
ncbi:hypothetical protein MLD38_040217 [Melastoma candidum]|uniref:Uncharacterized protein n=1 Tax=Melastoma candidum TaxID=119954 RepID=A0ACB9L5B5_9MYRT|nr:hypothetical protein MLD38_040217 [Melastoma candidum]